MLIDSKDLENIFISGLKMMGLPHLPWKSFQRYLDELQKWNEVINLTAITHPMEVVERHFLDSLSLLTVINDINGLRNGKNSNNVSRETLLDIGTGAGLPGIPIKIALPGVHVTLVEPIKKRVDFLKQVIRKLELKDISVLHRGINEGVSIGGYDIVTSRATFKLDELIALASRQVSSHGLIIAMKSSTEEVAQEMRQAEVLLLEYGLSKFEIYDYILPFFNVPRQLLVTRKL